jgi:hypothetical protein
MNNYIITPYVGVDSLEFGMKRPDTHKILGAPQHTRKSRFSKEVTDYWNDNGLQLTFSETEGELLEISLYPNLPSVELSGFKLFEEPGRQIYKNLCGLDGDPRETVGITILFKYGLAMTGFLNEDADQKSVTAFEAGRWDKKDPKLKPIIMALLK